MAPKDLPIKKLNLKRETRALRLNLLHSLGSGWFLEHKLLPFISRSMEMLHLLKDKSCKTCSGLAPTREEKVCETKTNLEEFSATRRQDGLIKQKMKLIAQKQESDGEVLGRPYSLLEVQRMIQVNEAFQ